MKKKNQVCTFYYFTITAHYLYLKGYLLQVLM